VASCHRNMSLSQTVSSDGTVWLDCKASAASWTMTSVMTTSTESLEGDRAGAAASGDQQSAAGAAEPLAAEPKEEYDTLEWLAAAERSLSPAPVDPPAVGRLWRRRPSSFAVVCALLALGVALLAVGLQRVFAFAEEPPPPPPQPLPKDPLDQAFRGLITGASGGAVTGVTVGLWFPPAWPIEAAIGAVAGGVVGAVQGFVNA